MSRPAQCNGRPTAIVIVGRLKSAWSGSLLLGQPFIIPVPVGLLDVLAVLIKIARKC